MKTLSPLLPSFTRSYIMMMWFLELQQPSHNHEAPGLNTAVRTLSNLKWKNTDPGFLEVAKPALGLPVAGILKRYTINTLGCLSECWSKSMDQHSIFKYNHF